jgi:WD40 repeat protein
MKEPPAPQEPPIGGELGCLRPSAEDTAIYALACSPDNRHALAAMQDTVFVLDLAEKQIVRGFKEHDCRVRCMAYSADGRQALTGDDRGGLVLWEVAAAKTLHWLEGHDGRVDGVACSPDGRRGLSGGDDGALLLWDLVRGKEVACLEESRFGITRVAFSPDGRLALAGDDDGNVSLWDVTSARLIWELPGPPLGPVAHVAFTPSGERALAAGRRRSQKGAPPIGQWEVASGRRFRTDYDQSARGRTTVTCVALAADGRRALAGGGPVGVAEANGRQFWYTPVHLWNIDSGIIEKTFRGHVKWAKTPYEVAGLIQRQNGGIVTDRQKLLPSRFPLATITSLAIAPDGRRALSGANDGTVRIWALSD